MKVVWFLKDAKGEYENHESYVENATDFLSALKLVDVITYHGEEYVVEETEIVANPTPYIGVMLA